MVSRPISCEMKPQNKSAIVYIHLFFAYWIIQTFQAVAVLLFTFCSYIIQNSLRESFLLRIFPKHSSDGLWFSAVIDNYCLRMKGADTLQNRRESERTRKQWKGSFMRKRKSLSRGSIRVHSNLEAESLCWILFYKRAMPWLVTKLFGTDSAIPALI